MEKEEITDGLKNFEDPKVEDSKAVEERRRQLLLRIHGVKTDKNARLYTRVSTGKQVSEGWSLEVQEKRLRDYCKSNNLNCKEVYIDKGISAKDYKNRPALNKLLADLQKLEKVIVVSLSRVARNASQFDEIYQIIQDKGAYLVMLDMDLDTSTANGKFMLGVMKQYAELERDLTSERTKVVMRAKLKDGQLKTKPPFGEMVVNGERVQNPREQDIIELIRSFKKEDPMITVGEVCDKLRKERISLNRKNPESKIIHHETVKRIMLNNGML